READQKTARVAQVPKRPSDEKTGKMLEVAGYGRDRPCGGRQSRSKKPRQSDHPLPFCEYVERCAHAPNYSNQLVCIATTHNLDYRAEHDRQIEANAPVVDVPYIVLYPSLHGLDRRRLSARTIYLGATSNARFH